MDSKDNITKINSVNYEWENRYNNQTPKKVLSEFTSKFGYEIISRNEEGYAKEIEFKLLIDNNELEVYLVGDFNDWGKDLDVLVNSKLEKDEHGLFARVKIKSNFLKHKDKYKYLVKDKDANLTFYEDPASSYFDDSGNSIFWDFNDPNSYKQKYDFIDTFNRSTKIIQTDLPGLISHYKSKNGVIGHQIKQNQIYKFISESGVIEEIKNLGFNTIQFLPFAQSIDGNNWKYRYLVPFQYAIQKNWGDPDEFAKMIDEFHKHGIAVIGDFVLGHIPHKDFKIFGQSSYEHGIHIWKNKNNHPVYLKEETSWGTMRIDFDNKSVREFFQESVIHFMKNYKIDGFRIDNVDGIIRYGENGDGEERPNGRNFLRELNNLIYDYNPSALIHYEGHYYYDDNAKLLVSPLTSYSNALGATCYNSSRITYYFHTIYMFKTSSDISVWKFKHINEEKEWGKSNSTVADFHNHDAAAGLMSMRCTGSYAFDSLKAVGAPEFDAIGKIKVMESIISFCLEGRTLNLLQTFLLQEGSFEHDSSIRWQMTFNENSKKLVNFKKEINKIMDNSAFFPINVNRREFLNVDDKNKVLVIERSSENENFVIIINTSSWTHHNYKVGVKSENNYQVIFSSDKEEFCGSNSTYIEKELTNNSSNNFEVLDRELNINTLGPYTCIVLKENKK
jgi:1,4-alpha-glucan branching enzyme